MKHELGCNYKISSYYSFGDKSMTFLEKIYFPKTSWTYVLCGYKMVNVQGAPKKIGGEKYV